MQTGTVVMMVIILTLLWGGFGALLVHAVRIERGRRRPPGSGG